MIVGERRM